MVIDGKVKVVKRKKIELVPELDNLKFGKILKKNNGPKKTDQASQNDVSDSAEAKEENKEGAGSSENKSG